MKIPNKREFQQIASSYSSDTASKDSTLPSDNPLSFRQNLSYNDC